MSNVIDRDTFEHLVADPTNLGTQVILYELPDPNCTLYETAYNLRVDAHNTRKDKAGNGPLIMVMPDEVVFALQAPADLHNFWKFLFQISEYCEKNKMPVIILFEWSTLNSIFESVERDHGCVFFDVFARFAFHLARTRVR